MSKTLFTEPMLRSIIGCLNNPKTLVPAKKDSDGFIKEYRYIPSSLHYLEYVAKDCVINKRVNAFEYILVDLGSGLGQTLVCLSKIMPPSFADIGVEKYITNSQLKIAVTRVIRKDLLKIRSFDFIKAQVIKDVYNHGNLSKFPHVFYCYNIFSDPKTMLEALKHWTAIMKPGDILYYTKTSSFATNDEAWFNNTFKYLGSTVYLFIKPIDDAKRKN